MFTTFFFHDINPGSLPTLQVVHLQSLVILDCELRYDHNGSGKVRVERIPDLILNLGRDLRLSHTLSIENMTY